MRTHRAKLEARVTAAFVVAGRLLLSVGEGLAQVRELVVAPAPTGIGVAAGMPGLPAGAAPATISPTTILSRGAILTPVALRQAALKRAPHRTTPVRALIRAQALASSDSRDVSPSPQRSTPSRGNANARAYAAPASGRGGPMGAARGRSPLGKMLLAPSVGTVQAFFDQARPAAEPEAPGVENLDELQVFLVREGRPALRASLGALDELLKADPALAASLNAEGKVRVVLDLKGPAGALQKADLERARRALRAKGVSAPLQTERIAVDFDRPDQPAPPQAGQEPSAPAPAAPGGLFQRWVARPLAWPFREAAFLARAMAAAYTKPQFWELMGGLGTEGISFAMTATTFAAAITLQHPILLGASLTFLLAQNAFHGLWLNTWTNFQDNLNKFRGPTYQTVFNWAYFQASGVVYRTLAWAAHPATTTAAWTLEYWRAIGLMSVVGTFFGVLGYNGLNQLYDKGRINRWQRSAIQQGRNLLFLLSGPLFGAGVLWLFWPLFWTLQALDLVLFVASLLARSRPILYVADAGTAASSEFKLKVPATAATKTVSPWQQAQAALKAQPPVMLALWLYKGARALRRWATRQGGRIMGKGPSSSPPS